VSGWVAIDRGMFDHPFFAPGPMSEREAWVWMICRAAWSDTEHRTPKGVEVVARGTFFCTLRDMQRTWGWASDKRVRGFLSRAEAAGMIKAKTDAGKTHVTICNYDEYQEAGRSVDAARTQRGRSTDALKKQGNKGTREQGIDIGADAPHAEKAFMPDGWVLSEEGWAYARKQNIPDEVIEDEARGFQAYWADRKDRDAKKSARGWEQCWANRCRSIAGRYASRSMAGKTTAGGYGQGGSIASIAARRRASGQV